MKALFRPLKLQEQRPHLFSFLLSVILCFLIEILNRSSFIAAVQFLGEHFVVFLLNALILYVCFSLALFFRKRGYGIFLIAVLWFAAGITDFILLKVRTSPFSAADILLIKSCLPVIGKYLSIRQMVLIGILLIALIVGIVLIRKKFKKYEIKFKKEIPVFLLTAALVYALLTAAVLGGILSIRFSSLSEAYKDYGFAYCFSAGIFTRGISRPPDYSEESVSEILDKIEKDAEEDENGIKEEQPGNIEIGSGDVCVPNIIFLQLESFFDVNRMAGISFSENPVPVFTELKEKYSSGYLSVPSVGAGTANVEFEVMTGMNLDDFGAGEYPFNTILRTKSCESTGNNLKQLGYTAHAIHNNIASFYGRDIVFSSLGYDTFTSLEYMENVQYNPLGWAKDSCLIGAIRDCLDSAKGRDYIYAISVQAHGGYPEDETEENFFDSDNIGTVHLTGKVDAVLSREEREAMTISVSGFEDADLCAQWEYYVNQINEVDSFVGELTERLSGFSEPTVLVIYGDHLPSLSITDEDLGENGSLLQSEYVIWSNFEMEKRDEDLEAYQLSAAVLDYLDIHEGIICALHQSERGKPDYLDSLTLLEYDMLYGDNISGQGEELYPFTDIQFGINKVRIDKISFNEASAVIDGEHFTPFSVVYVNEEKTDTEYCSSSLLFCPDLQLHPGDSVIVCQEGAEKVLSRTEAYIIK